jgi:uncharacterized membrane protein YebE (DUF533 family)
MTLFRSKSIGEELLGRAERIAGAAAGHHPREALGAMREYAGHAGALATQAMGNAGRGVRRHAGLSIAIGTGLGLGAIAAAYLMSRRQARLREEHDEHDPTRQSPMNGNSPYATSEGAVVPGETGLY